MVRADDSSHFCFSNCYDVVIPPEDHDELPVWYPEKMYRFIPLLYAYAQEDVKHNSEEITGQGQALPLRLLEGWAIQAQWCCSEDFSHALMNLLLHFVENARQSDYVIVAG